MSDSKASQTGAEEKTSGPSPEPPEQPDISIELRAHVPADIRDASFPVSVRGYDRRAVDAYIHRVNRVIAELEVSRSPQAAVRHAVNRVAEQTKAILQQARESGEEITAAARVEAEEIMASAKAQAADLVVNASADADRARAEAKQIVANARDQAADALARSKAEAEDILARARAEAAAQRKRLEEELAAAQEQAEARMHELRADTEAVWKERHDLLAEMHAMASRLQEIPTAAAARFSPQESAKPADEASPEPVARSGSQAERVT